MSRAILNLPQGVRITTVDAQVAELARVLGCKVVTSTDPFGNRSYTLDPVYTPPQARKVVPLHRVPPMFTPDGGCAA